MKPKGIKRNRKLITQSSIQRVLEIFFRYPEKEFSLSDVAQLAGVAKPNIGTIIKKLEQASFITITKLSKIWRIRAKQDNQKFIQYKMIYNLNCIYQSGLVEFLNQYYGNPKAIILFGSFRRAEDLSTSDIDIAVEIDEPEEYHIPTLKEVSEFEKAIERKIQIHLFNRKKVDLNVFNNIANGIILSGFLEVKP